jgi:hypothetical protein
MKTFLTYVILIVLAQSSSIISMKELGNLSGCWSGSLTYLDYTSGKPFTLSADLSVKQIGNSEALLFATSYPSEPKANSLDTARITGSGQIFRNEKIASKRNISKDSLEFITEIEGKDGNDHKPAILRHIYLVGKRALTIRKEVKFIGESNWTVRNEYRFIRLELCK